MNDNPATVSPQDTLAKALATMADHKTRHVVVVDKDSVVGILSDRDLSIHFNSGNKTQQAWEQMQVAEVMTPRPLTIGSMAEIREAARLLLREAISAMPVVDNGQLAGLLSDRDFTRYFARKS
ncbi:MAG: CBS domain-containing protein [Deltaproteobacteria bacterium]|nr:CBS domain-containing protein [Deltaproteobacteria bacterium]